MPDESGSLVELAGSARSSLPDVTDTAPVDTDERAEITVVLRRRAELPAEIVEAPTVLSHAELGEGYGADPADVDLVSRELTSRGLEVTEVHLTTRRVKVAGSLGDLSSAFGTTLRQVSSPDPSGPGGGARRDREGARPRPRPPAGRRPKPRRRAPRPRRTRWRRSTTSRPAPPARARR